MDSFLITAPYSKNGGVSSFVLNILPELSGKVVLFRRGNQVEKGLLYNLFFLILLPMRFAWALLTVCPKRVIINTSLSSSLLFRDGILVLLSKLFSRKTLLIIHGFNENALEYRQLMKWGYFKADAICVLADEFRKQIILAGYKRKIYVQLNPVSKEILDLEQPLLPPVSRLLYIGRIETAKGIYITLDTFKLLKGGHPEMTLDIVGMGNEYNNVVKYIKDHRIYGVTMHGFKSGKEKTDILKSCGLCSFSSYKEGLPISILEAMAVGQLIISRPIGGIVDLYKQCDFGKIIDSMDAKDFAEAYEELIGNPTKLEQIRRHNIEFAKEHFSPKAIVEKIERIFSEMN